MPLIAILIALALVWWNRGERSADTPDRAVVADDATLGIAAGDAVAAGAKRLTGPVTKIVDGDTLHVELAGSVTPKEKVRLLRINTPERGRPGFERATAALVALVEGKTVDLVFEDPAKPERDEFGRLLAYVWVGDVCANVELVRGGWTRFFTKYGEGWMAEEFRAAEVDARAAGAGLWNGDEWNTR